MAQFLNETGARWESCLEVVREGPPPLARIAPLAVNKFPTFIS